MPEEPGMTREGCRAVRAPDVAKPLPPMSFRNECKPAGVYLVRPALQRGAVPALPSWGFTGNSVSLTRSLPSDQAPGGGCPSAEAFPGDAIAMTD